MDTKYYCEHQCTCNILLFKYLMSKLIDLHMDWETFNKLPALEQSGAANIYEGIF